MVSELLGVPQGLEEKRLLPRRREGRIVTTLDSLQRENERPLILRKRPRRDERELLSWSVCPRVEFLYDGPLAAPSTSCSYNRAISIFTKLSNRNWR